MLAETEAVLAGRSIRWLRYRDGGSSGRGRSFFGDDVVQCQNLDKHYTFSDDSVLYHVLRLVVPMDGWNGSCVLPTQGEVAVILLAYETLPGGATVTYESQTALLESAEALGMEVYLAGPKIPAARNDKGEATAKADPELFQVHLEWAKRFTQDALTRYGTYSSFAGFYQSREVPLKGDSEWTATEYDYYRQDVEGIKSVPGAEELKYLISPYMRGYGVSPEEAAEGFERLAETGVDAILPQDRRGGGRAALYWPYEGSKVIGSSDVDPILAGYEDLAGSYYNELYCRHRRNWIPLPPGSPGTGSLLKLVF